MALFAAWLASDFMPTLYELKLWPGLTIPPLLVTCARLMMYKMSNTTFIHRTHPHVVSLRRTYASLFPSADFNNLLTLNVSAFLGQVKKALFLPSCTDSFFMSRLAFALLDWRPFSFNPCNPCNLLEAAQRLTLPCKKVLCNPCKLHSKLCCFILDIMPWSSGQLLGGDDQPQTNQPNDLAGGTLACNCNL